MKKYFIILIAFLIMGLIGWWLLMPSEAESDANIHDQSEISEVKNINKIVVALSDLAVAVDTTKQLSHRNQTSNQTVRKTLWEQREFPERLQVADLDMPLLFEKEVSDELKQVILADLNLILGHTTGHELYETPANVFRTSSNGESFRVSKWLSLKGLSVARPREYREVFGGVAEINGVEYVVIPTDLIQAYENAWVARNEHPEKYENLGSFIEWLNTASISDLKTNNPYWLFGYDGISDAHPEKAAELKENLLPARREDLRVRHPSILEFTYVDHTVLEKQDMEGKLPPGVTLADGKYIDEDGVPYQQALFLYDGKEWHIAFMPAGT